MPLLGTIEDRGNNKYSQATRSKRTTRTTEGAVESFLLNS